MKDFLERLQSEILIEDGAMGTLIYARGVPLGVCYDELSVSQPELIGGIHREYVAAGAQIIETNSFGANRFKLARHGLEDQVRAINLAAARLARQEAGPNVLVAGSVGPIVLPYDAEEMTTEDKEALFREPIEALLEGGCDLIQCETFNNLADAQLALRAVRSLTRKPVICSLSLNEGGSTQDGVPVAEAFGRLRAAGADVVGLNCLLGPHGIRKLLSVVPVDEQSRLLANPNAGRPEYVDGRYVYLSTPQYFADMAVNLIAEGARLVGGCCGTTPEHIRAIAAAVRELRPVQTKTVVITVPPPPKPERVAPPQETILDIIKQRTLIVTELDPPRTLEYEKIIEGAWALKEAGTDSVTLADNSLAVVRLSNIAMARLLKDRVGLIPLVHLACRDRNLIGMQSDLMGMAVLGLDHVLALTGDPAKVGDVPEATSVYDLTSISLLELIAKLNRGQGHSGRPLKRATHFVTGCAFNPNIRRLEIQVRRLERKLQAGAQYVMTQPIYDPAKVKETYEATQQFGIPILMGVMPLLSGRNCEFLHNEVPGIEIPDDVRERLRGRDGAAGAAEGLAIAREVTEEILSYFPGIYFITPMTRYDLTVELSRFVRTQSTPPK